MANPLITEAFLKDAEHLANITRNPTVGALVNEVRRQRTEINTLLTELTELRNTK